MRKLGIILLVTSLVMVGCQQPTSPAESTKDNTEQVVEQPVVEVPTETPSETPVDPPVEQPISIEKTAMKFMESKPSSMDIVQMIMSDTIPASENTKLLYELVKLNDNRVLDIMNNYEIQSDIYQGFQTAYTNNWNREIIDTVGKDKLSESQYTFFKELNDRYMRIIPLGNYLTFDSDYEGMIKDLEGHVDQEGKDFLRAAYNTFLAIEATKAAEYSPFDGKKYVDKVYIVESFLNTYPTSMFYQQVEGYYQRLVFGYFIYENGSSAFSPENGRINPQPFDGLVYARDTYPESVFGVFASGFVQELEGNQFVRPNNLMSIINSHKAFGYHSTMEMELLESKEPIISTYPVFKNIVNDAFTNEINQTIMSQRDAMVEDYGYDPVKDADVKAVLYTSIAMTNEKIISGYTNGSFAKGSDRKEYFSTFNFDVVNQRPLTLLGLMTDDELGSQLILQKVEEAHSRSGFTVKDYQIDSQSIFYIDSQYLYLVVPNKYSDYPYEKGLTVLIPRREITNILPSDI